MIIPDSVVKGLDILSKRDLMKTMPSEDHEIYEAGLFDGCTLLAQEILKTVQQEPTGDKADA